MSYAFTTFDNGAKDGQGMTTQTIRNGTSIEVVIPTGQTLKVVAVSGTYNASVVRGTGIGTTLSTLATGASYGPYAYDSVVRLVSSDASEIDFDVAVTPVVDSDTEPKFAFDSTGAVTGLVGPGGSSYPISPVGIEFAQHIRRFSGKLSQAYNSQINIGVIGHSVVAGAYSNDTVANNDGAWNTSGWVAVMRSYFQGRFGTASPKGGLFPAELFSTNFTVAGGAALNGPNNSVGLGGNRVDLAAAANTCTVTGTGRYLRVWGFATTAGVAARYNTDGGGLNTAGTTSSGASPNGQFWYVFDIDCATDAAHSVVLQGAASGSWYMYGFAFYSQTSTGVVVHRMGWSGKVLPDLIASSLDATDTAGPAWRTTLTANGKEQQLQSITTQMGLHLAVIMVDVNDLTGGWTSYSYTLADVKRHAQNIATALAAKNIDVVFAVGLWRDPSSYGANVPFDQQQVIDAYREVASATDRVALMDFTKAYPTYAEFNADGYMQDTVHPTSLGHAWMGRVLYNELISL